MQKYTLKNGVNLYYSDDDRFKTASISLCIYRALDNTASETALLGGVLKSACAKYPTKQEIEKNLANMYGASLGANVRKKGEVQILSFTVVTPTDRYTGENTSEMAANLVYETVFNPLLKCDSFDENIVAIEKENLKNRIFAMMNDKREYATYRMLGEMCKDEPFGIYELGNIESIDKITASSLKAHYDKIIADSRIDIFVMGKCNIESVISKFDSVYSNGKMPETTFVPKVEQENYVEEKMDVMQGKLVIGMRLNKDFSKEDYPKALVFNSVFGSGTHSKLFNNVREKLSLAYYAYSRLIRAKSILNIGTGIEFEKFSPAKDEIFAQLEEIKKGNISDNELLQARESIRNSFVSLYDSPLSLEDFYLNQLVCGDERDIETLISQMLEVTAQDIADVAKTAVTDTVYFLKGTDK